MNICDHVIIIQVLYIVIVQQRSNIIEGRLKGYEVSNRKRKFNIPNDIEEGECSSQGIKNGNTDFVIKVEDVSYPVHQNILISGSEHFRGMFAHKTKERQDRFVEIKEIDSKTMKLCIEFMYDHDIDVTMETAKTLLPASEFLQLTELSKRCVVVLRDNLYSGNCITVLTLARAYNCSELAETALDILKEEFKMKNYEDFCELDKEGLMQHINDLDMEITWDGIINWIKLDVENRSSDIVELVKMLNWKRFPSSCFLHFVWSEPLFKSSEFCKNWVFKKLFRSNKTLEKELNEKNCLIICKIASEFVFLCEEAKQTILDFIGINLVMLTNDPEFKYLSKDIILDLFLLKDVGLCDETLRWRVTKNWMKHNPEQEDLLKCIRFDLMPKDYMKSTVLLDPLLNESQKNVLQCLLKSSNDETYIAVLCSDGVVRAWNILDKTWYRLPDCPKKGVETKMFSFCDELCILVDGELFYLGKNETKWIPRATLKHRLSKFFTVVSSNDRIYIVEKERISSYDPDTNTWDESLPGCDLDGKIFAGCTSDQICVRNTNYRERTYFFREGKWNQITSTKYINTYGAMASYDEKIFVVGIWNGYNCFAAECYNNGWKGISQIPVNIDNPCHLFFVDERLFLLNSGILYHYVDIFENKWMNYCPLPQYTCLGMTQNLNPVSVCSFKGNLTNASTVKE